MANQDHHHEVLTLSVPSVMHDEHEQRHFCVQRVLRDPSCPEADQVISRSCQPMPSMRMNLENRDVFSKVRCTGHNSSSRGQKSLTVRRHCAELLELLR